MWPKLENPLDSSDVRIKQSGQARGIKDVRRSLEIVASREAAAVRFLDRVRCGGAHCSCGSIGRIQSQEYGFIGGGGRAIHHQYVQVSAAQDALESRTGNDIAHEAPPGRLLIAPLIDDG